MAHASTIIRENGGSNIIMNSKNCAKNQVSEMKLKKEGWRQHAWRKIES